MPTGAGGSSDRLRLADLLAALSLVTDLGMGFPPEHAACACLMATALARRVGLPEGEVADVYFTALIKHIGCTAFSREQAAYVGGDDNASLAYAAGVDFGDPRQAISATLGLGKGLPPARRARLVAGAVVRGKRWGRDFGTAFCEVGAELARRMGLGPAVVRGLNEYLEGWDGKGDPRGLAGEDIAPPARFARVADQVILFERVGGWEAARDAVRARAGGMLDPAIAAVFLEHGQAFLAEIAAADPMAAVVQTEPDPVQWVPETRLDDVACAFGDMADMKSPYLSGHSRGVAELAEGAARALGLDDAEAVALRRAGLLHDLGRAGVPTGVWEKPGRLTAAEWELVRLHPYHTERILARSPALAPLATAAGMHHERQDGSGYHRQASQGALPMPARVLAAADAFQAATQERAHRRAASPDEAADRLRAEAEAGRLDPEAVGAVLAAAGQERGPVRRPRPAGLTDREVEVVNLVARGLSTKEVGARLFISPKTVEHHLEHVYAKLGVSSRAALALFAVEHDLLAR